MFVNIYTYLNDIDIAVCRSIRNNYPDQNYTQPLWWHWVYALKQNFNLAAFYNEDFDCNEMKWHELIWICFQPCFFHRDEGRRYSSTSSTPTGSTGSMRVAQRGGHAPRESLQPALRPVVRMWGWRTTWFLPTSDPTTTWPVNTSSRSAASISLREVKREKTPFLSKILWLNRVST